MGANLFIYRQINKIKGGSLKNKQVKRQLNWPIVVLMAAVTMFVVAYVGSYFGQKLFGEAGEFVGGMLGMAAASAVIVFSLNKLYP